MIIISDGKLTFDTAINDKGFEKGIGDLIEALDRVTKATDGLSAKITDAFKIDTNQTQSAAKQVENSIDGIKQSTQDATQATQSFEEQWEAISKQHPEWQEQQSPITEETVQETQSAAEKVVEAVDKVYEEVKKPIPEMNDDQLDKTEEKIYTIQERIDACKDHLQSLSSQGMGFGDQEYDETYVELSKLEQELKEYKARLLEGANTSSKTSRIVAGLKGAFNGAVAGVKKFAKVIGTVGSKLGSIASKASKAGISFLSMVNPLKKVHSASNGCGNSIEKVGKRILNLAKTALVFSVLRKAFSSLGTYLRSMLMTNNQFASSMAQIKGNLLTAFQPIYEACLPAINALASGLATVCGYIAQFTSMLFGKSVSASQAAAKAQYDQVQAYKDTGSAAKKAGKDAKEAQKQLSDIDELHVLNDNNNVSSDTGTGTSSGGTAPDFTTGIDTSSGVSDLVKKLKEAWNTADFTEIGETIATKINDALVKIPWGAIQETAGKIGKSLATFINGAANVKELWDTLGKTIGEGINTGIEAANSFVSNLNWSDIGDSIGRSIDSLIKTVNWNELADTFVKYYNGIFDGIDSFINEIDWANTGTLLGESMQTLFSGIDFDGIGKTISDGLNHIAELINNLYARVDFVGLGSNMASGLNTMLTDTDWANVGKSIGNGLNTAIDTLYGLIHDFDWKEFGSSIAESLNNVLTTTNWEELAHGASDLVRGLANSLITCIREFDWEQLGSTLGDMFCEIDWGGIATDAVDLLIEAFNALVSGVVGFFKKLGGNIIDGLSEGISLGEILSDAGKWIKEHIFDPIVNNFKKLFGIHSPSTVFKDLGSYIMQGLVNGITSLVDKAKKLFSDLLSDIKSFFTNIPKWFGDKFGGALSKIKEAFSVKNMKAFFKEVWEGIKSCFSNVSSWFKDTFSKAWQKVKDVFSKGGKIFDGIKDGIVSAFKSVVNALIGGINKIIATPFNAINGMLNTIHDISILGIKPFSGLWSKNPLSVPQIPKLATGTVVPANYGEFAAILGDNKRETEVVSPLSTIKQALKEAMMENGASGNGDVNLYLELIMDGQKVYSVVKKINKENASAGKESFALA